MPDPTDQQHEDAFIAAIQPEASLADIDAFIAIQAEQAAHEQQVIEENS